MTVFPSNSVEVIYDELFDKKLSAEMSPLGDLVGFHRLIVDGIELFENEKIFVRDSEDYGVWFPATYCYYHDGELYAKTESGTSSYRYAVIPRDTRNV